MKEVSNLVHFYIAFGDKSGEGAQVLRVCEFFCGAWKLSLLAFLLLNWVRPVFRPGSGWGGGVSLPFSTWCAQDQSHCLEPSS